MTTNNLGNVALVGSPNYLSSVTTASSSLFTVNNAGYDPSTAGGTTACVVPSQAITGGTVASYRLVSASIRVTPTNSVLNMAGVMHGAILSHPPTTLKAATFSDSANYTYLSALNAITNSLYYNCANIDMQQGIRMLWYPHDECNYELITIDNCPANQGNDPVPTWSVIIVGAPASTKVAKVEITQNFEITPSYNSIMQGLENVGEEETLPLVAAHQLVVKHGSQLVSKLVSKGNF